MARWQQCSAARSRLRDLNAMAASTEACSSCVVPAAFDQNII